MVSRSIFEDLKVIHSIKNLFCYVVLICNLVQEFNGLVSKGSAVLLALLLFFFLSSLEMFLVTECTFDYQRRKKRIYS
jgi:hypothetical protein